MADEADLGREDDDDQSDGPSDSGEQVIQIDETIARSGDGAAAPATAVRPTRPTLKRKITRITHTFDVEFEHLGLTLSNGTSILQVFFFRALLHFPITSLSGLRSAT